MHITHRDHQYHAPHHMEGHPIEDHLGDHLEVVDLVIHLTLDHPHEVISHIPLEN